MSICSICCNDFTWDPSASDKSRLPVQSRKCSHCFCYACICALHTQAQANVLRSQPVISCPICRAGNAFVRNKPMFNLMACELLEERHKLRAIPSSGPAPAAPGRLFRAAPTPGYGSSQPCLATHAQPSTGFGPAPGGTFASSFNAAAFGTSANQAPGGFSGGLAPSNNGGFWASQAATGFQQTHPTSFSIGAVPAPGEFSIGSSNTPPRSKRRMVRAQRPRR
jgi:hypothetical protein